MVLRIWGLSCSQPNATTLLDRSWSPDLPAAVPVPMMPSSSERSTVRRRRRRPPSLCDCVAPLWLSSLLCPMISPI